MMRHGSARGGTEVESPPARIKRPADFPQSGPETQAPPDFQEDKAQTLRKRADIDLDFSKPQGKPRGAGFVQMAGIISFVLGLLFGFSGLILVGVRSPVMLVAAVLFVGGVLAIGLGVVIEELTRIREILKR